MSINLAEESGLLMTKMTYYDNLLGKEATSMLEKVGWSILLVIGLSLALVYYQQWPVFCALSACAGLVTGVCLLQETEWADRVGTITFCLFGFIVYWAILFASARAEFYNGNSYWVFAAFVQATGELFVFMLSMTPFFLVDRFHHRHLTIC